MLVQSKDKMADWAWAGLGLRVALAASFLYHGLTAFASTGGIHEFGNMLSNFGIPGETAAGAVVAGLEVACGLLLLIGLFTRLATVILALGCLFVIFRVDWPKGFTFIQPDGTPAGGWEPYLTWVLALWALFMMGPGKFSLEEGKAKAPAAAPAKT